MHPYRVIGIESSPYAVKVRAVMRYRRLPHVWVARMPQFFAETQHVRPLIMPVVQFPDGTYRSDSTPIIHALEQEAGGARSVLPANRGLDFLSDLIEDLADEWLTKSLFHFRFSRDADRRSGAGWVIDDAHADVDGEQLPPMVQAFIERQVSRMPLVGCTPANGGVLERFYLELLDALESFVATDRFLFGSRPSLADFGLFGQLYTLAHDPTPMAIMRERAPRTWRWVLRLDDASGVEGDWRDPAEPAPAVVAQLLELAGRYYLPFLDANARAIDQGETEVAAVVDGDTFRQPAYRYQRKCFDYLKRRFAALPDAARQTVSPLLEANGCLRWLD